MSKKTNAEKQRAKKKPRRHIARRGKRPNPARAFPPTGSIPGLLGDQIFLHHMAGALLRALQLYPPSVTPLSPGEFTGEVDAEFLEEESRCTACGISASQAHEVSMGLYCRKSENGMHRFEGLASTVNSDSPDAEEQGKAEE